MAEPTGRPETAVRVVSARGVLAPVRRGDAAATASRRETSEKAPRTRPNARGAVAREERLAGLDVAGEGREGREERAGGERRGSNLLVGLKLDRRGLLRLRREGDGRGGEESDGELHGYMCLRETAGSAVARGDGVSMTENDVAPSARAEPILGAAFEPRAASGRLGDASAAWRPRGAARGGVLRPSGRQRSDCFYTARWRRGSGCAAPRV